MKQKVVYLAYTNNLDIPTVFALIKCESGFNENAEHYNDNKTIDRGLLQINSIHTEAMKDMGLDIKKSDDSLIFGFWLLRTEGIQHWNSSKKCWGKYVV